MIATITKIVHRISDMIPFLRLRIWRLYVCDQSSFRPSLNPEIRPIKIDPNQLDLLKTIKPILDDPRSMTTRFEQGNDCWIVRLDNVPVYFVWIITNPTDRPMAPGLRARAPRQLMLPPKSIYIWDSWCSQAYRCRGINRQAASAIISDYFSKGFTAVYSLIAPFNAPSIASRASSGFQPRGLMIECHLGHRPPG